MTLREQLGYWDALADPVLSPDRLQTAQAIVTRLTEVDTLIAQALPDSMAAKVGELVLNYPQHLVSLKLEGSRLLRHLAALTGLPVKHDRYRDPSQPTSLLSLH